MPLSPLPAKYYDHPVLEVARSLLGARLVRCLNGKRLAGYIVEAEAYQGESDLACHARAGRTARTEVMYGPPGRAYIYFIYGMHWMLNCVTGPPGSPEAVLIRSIIPTEGLDEITKLRSGQPFSRWTNGPARLCQALAIDSRFNGADLTQTQSGLWIEPGHPVPGHLVITGPRVGIDNVPEPWRSLPWRFRVDLRSWQPPAETSSPADSSPNNTE